METLENPLFENLSLPALIREKALSNSAANLSLFTAFKENTEHLHLSDYEKAICWKRAFLMAFSELVSEPSVVVAEANRATYTDKDGVEKEFTAEMASLAFIYLLMLDVFCEQWGREEMMDMFSCRYSFLTVPPFDEDEIIERCRQDLLDHGATEEEIRLSSMSKSFGSKTMQ